MYSTYNEDAYDPRSNGVMTPAVKNLIIINVIFYLISMVNDALYGNIISIFGLIPYDVIHKFYIWQLVSYMFLHGGMLHILLNMFFLWMFGSELERAWGSKEFYKFYFITGIGAGLFNVLFQPMSGIPIVGASGATYGLLAAFGLMYPNRMILLYFIMPVKVKYVVIGMAALSFFAAFSSSQDGIAHFAHLGGMVIGFLYLKLGLQSKEWEPNGFIKKIILKFKHPHLKVHRTEKPKDKGADVDKILDRINEVGYDNLTDKEKQTLKDASQHLSDDDRK